MYYQEEKKTAFTLLLTIIIILGGIIAGFIITRIFIFPFTISDSSMEPSFQKGDMILAARFSSLEKGTVVIMKSPVEPDRALVKRIIASEGDTIEIRNKIIYRNNSKFTIPWKNLSADKRIFPMNFSFRDNMPAVKLKRGEFFVIGDNIDISFDSRTFGIIREDSIKGGFLYKIFNHE